MKFARQKSVFTAGHPPIELNTAQRFVLRIKSNSGENYFFAFFYRYRTRVNLNAANTFILARAAALDEGSQESGKFNRPFAGKETESNILLYFSRRSD
jgi:hypothetical protein